MHQALLVVDALLQGDHGFGPVDTVNVIYRKNNFLGVFGVFSPHLTENVKFSCCNMGYGNKRNTG